MRKTLVFIAVISLFVIIPILAIADISVTSSFDKDEYDAGDSVTVSWSIIGAKEPYSSFEVEINGWTANGSHISLVNTKDSSFQSLTYDNINNSYVNYRITFFDADNVFKTYTSDKVKVTGDVNEPSISITSSFDKDEYIAGDSVTVSWSIEGIKEPYNSFQAEIIGWSADGALIRLASTDDSSLQSLTCSNINVSKINYTIYFFDADSVFKTFTSELLTVQSNPSLPSLEAEYVQDGWVSESGKWYYYQQGTPVTNNWVSDGAWYYFDASGAMVTGWLYIDGTWYYFNTSGAMATGWISDGGVWYYFNASGAMVTGWQSDSGTWYYFKPSGSMATGWISDGGTWYYFNASGAMATGWISDGGTWYYFKPSGAMAIGWISDSGKWYYFDASGAMATGWLELKENGKSIWYWFDNNGQMATGWKEINGQWEMFDNSGVWLYTWDGN